MKNRKSMKNREHKQSYGGGKEEHKEEKEYEEEIEGEFRGRKGKGGRR